MLASSGVPLALAALRQSRALIHLKLRSSAHTEGGGGQDSDSGNIASLWLLAAAAHESKLPESEANMDSSLARRDPEIMSGALCFTGTRVPVKNLFDYLEGSSSLEEFLEDFPSVSRARAVAVLEAAHEILEANAPVA